MSGSNLKNKLLGIILFWNLGISGYTYVPYIFVFSNWAIGRNWSNLSTIEKDKYLEEALGPQHKSGEKKVVAPTIIYSAISILGIPGNILTCLTIITNSYLKTPPNYFIFNLAAVDLVTLIIGKYFLY